MNAHTADGLAASQSNESPWAESLTGLNVQVVAPRLPVVAPDACTSPGAALAVAGGVPCSAPATPLLVALNDPDRATRSVPALAGISAAVGEREIRVVVATGSHVFDEPTRRAHEAPLRAVAGDIAIRWHSGTGDAAETTGGHVTVGEYSCDPWLAEAQDVVAIGSVEPHWFAGLTGSYKTLSVGLMSRADIAKSHVFALDVAARPLVLVGNPVHEEIVRTMDALLEGRSVVALDHLGEQWVAGSPVDNLHALLPIARERWGCAVEKPLDFLVARVLPPLDGVLYQAEKGLKNSEHAVRDGGVIVIDAACERGVGPRRFMDLLARAPDESAARALIDAEGYRLGDHKAVRLRALQGRGVAIGVVAPTFPRADADVAGIRVLADRAEAAAFIKSHVGDGASGVFLEDGAHTVVHLQEQVNEQGQACS